MRQLRITKNGVLHEHVDETEREVLCPFGMVGDVMNQLMAISKASCMSNCAAFEVIVDDRNISALHNKTIQCHVLNHRIGELNAN